MSESVKKNGRPSKYTRELAIDICDRISNGESLASITKEDGYPHKSTVYEWLLDRPDFRDLYTRAREDQADTLADEIQKIADEEPMYLFDDKGNKRVDNGYVSWIKHKTDTRKWIASKLKPQKYGDRIGVEGVKDGEPVKMEVTALFDAIVDNLELTRQNEDE